MPLAPKTSVGLIPTAVSTLSTPKELSELVNWLYLADALGKEVIKIDESSRPKNTFGAAKLNGDIVVKNTPVAMQLKRNKLHIIRLKPLLLLSMSCLPERWNALPNVRPN